MSPDSHTQEKIEDLIFQFSLSRRYLAMQKESEFVLKEALRICEQECGEVSTEVADTLNNLSSTYKHMGLYHEGRYSASRLSSNFQFVRSNLSTLSIKYADYDLLMSPEIYILHFCLCVAHIKNIRNQFQCVSTIHADQVIIPLYRKCLERALEIYDSQYTYYSNHPAKAHILTNLGSTWRSLGDSLKSKELFENALAIQEQLHEPQHPSVSSKPENKKLHLLTLLSS